jgi:hypothetical protein
MPTPTPRHFRKRGWICLIAKELTFLEVPKSPQNTENMGVATETLRHRGRKLMKIKGGWRVTSSEIERRADEKTGFATGTPRHGGGQALGRKWGARRHMELLRKKGTRRGHGQQNLGLKITASITVCQVINKACELNALQGSLQSGSAAGSKDQMPHPCENQRRKDGPPKIV